MPGFSIALTDEQRLLIDTVRRFVRTEILPLEPELDPDAYELPRAHHERLTAMTRAMGLWQLGVPADLGGAGLDVVTHSLIAQELSQHRAGVIAPCYNVFGVEPPAPLFAAEGELREKYLDPCVRGEKSCFFGLTEPSGGSDPARAIQTRGVRDGDDWIINGSKVFNSGADTADFGLMFVRTDPSRGRSGITCFIVETNTPGFQVVRLVHVLRSHYTTELALQDVRVPHANILGAEGAGFGIANARLTRRRVAYTSGCVGVARAAQKMGIEYSKGRSTFGETLASRQAIQWMLVDNEIDIQTSHLLVMQAAARADSGEPFRFEAAMAKLVGTEGAGRVVDRVMQIHGGYGVTKDLPLERWYRELRIRRIGEGPSEVQRVIMARDLLGQSFSRESAN